MTCRAGGGVTLDCCLHGSCSVPVRLSASETQAVICAWFLEILLSLWGVVSSVLQQQEGVCP